ncbi:MAG TPA: hypothetical protein VG502_16205 [Flexivirga sp.]|uniref:hypothetical protein n=1 Tax=Flexivirga sp. TaxID=1962927 RepID=UPI002BE85C59|nr:hypothetical protein [Flexivirga sp.]HWC23839.1 hypothetical protein [Flexivirga sp.]
MSAVAILDQARDVLDSTSPSRNRIACWLARSALEQVVRELLSAKGRPVGRATMASSLTCLEVAYAADPLVADRAEFAWARLSNACHQHAFELSPTASEAANLVEIVAELAAVT